MSGYEAGLYPVREPKFKWMYVVSSISPPPSATEDFTKLTRVHDWRNYVPECLRKAWPDLLEETRMAVALVCDDVASDEEWE